MARRKGSAASSQLPRSAEASVILRVAERLRDVATFAAIEARGPDPADGAHHLVDALRELAPQLRELRAIARRNP